MTDEVQDLDNLLKHPGWLRFNEYGLKEAETRVMNATRNAANIQDDVQALHVLRQCVAARDAIEMLLAWPASRLRVLQDKQAVQLNTAPQLSRRGTL